MNSCQEKWGGNQKRVRELSEHDIGLSPCVREAEKRKAG